MMTLDILRAAPFVRRVRYVHAPAEAIEIVTAGGSSRLPVIVKRSFLDTGAVNAILGRVAGMKRSGQHPFLLTPYIPATTGKAFMEAGLSFADEAGNMHLALGDQYSFTLLGERKPRRLPEAARITAGTLQYLFQLATHPDTASQTVRELAESTGLSKSAVAEIRRTMKDRPDLKPDPDQLISGYSQILRPKLVIGRFRYQEPTADRFLERLVREARTKKIPYALTGGPAADAMQHLYRTPDVPIFLEARWQRTLRLLPDRTGPLVMLRPFGQLVYWKDFGGRLVAPPWLTYAELLISADPRAREVAEHFRQEFLP